MDATKNIEFPFSIEKFKTTFNSLDPRIPVALVLFTFLVLGLTVLGFNRSPAQAITTTLSCCLLELVFCRIFKKKWVFPLSAMITSFSLSFLLNFSHDFFLLFIPLFFAIGSKYLFQINAKHALNPAMMGVALSLLLSRDLVTAAPAYQWNGSLMMALFVLLMGFSFVVTKVNRIWLITSFLAFFTLQTALRAWIMRYHLPFETLFLGTLSSPSFLIFTFFMITDPATSPNDKKDQIWVGFWLAALDLFFHLFQSYYTFFYAALTLGLVRLSLRHYRQTYGVGLFKYLQNRFINSGYWKQPLLLAAVGISGQQMYEHVLRPIQDQKQLSFHLKEVSSETSGLNASNYGGLLHDTDPRIHHIVKWILSVGDAVAVSDFNNDGLPDLFLTNLLKEKSQRASLYLNTGNYQFKKVPVPDLDSIIENPKSEGIISNAIFVDYDNDGDQDLYLTVGFGHNRLLKNHLKETGQAKFSDVTKDSGLGEYNNSLSATFTDLNQDGLLDLVVLNVWPENLPGYDKPTRLNIFDLPQPEYDGDIRMFNFMHDSWHRSHNGGTNRIYLQTTGNKFEKQNEKAWNFTETNWSLVVGAADFNQDGWPDLYIANDFGPDDLYLNQGGKTFLNYKGKIFGSIGRDTYKGMNVSVADFDRTGWMQAVISNVHQPMQAEGTLFWTFSRDASVPEGIRVEEMATQKGILNEHRFGWGAAATDLDLDGWMDLLQANGMVDDTYDKKYEKCPDYWYVNEKIARSPPEIHSFANFWGDIRGYCIWGQEAKRIYLNRGTEIKPQFLDVAPMLGFKAETGSRGVATADFNSKGRRDVIFTHQFKAPGLYENQAIGSQPNWIGIELESQSPDCNREAIGSRVEVYVNEAQTKNWSMVQETQVVSGFSSQSEKRLLFGLGLTGTLNKVIVHWCGKIRKEYTDLQTLHYNRILLK